jgi:D-arabinose 1-dehydrogenase-like Zn-dependent alcohol dehydrogenase
VPVKVYGNNAHGGHAQYLKMPANTLVPLPDELSFSAGAAIACGSGTAYSALRCMNLSGNDPIAIFGQGPVGLAATQYTKGDGCESDRARHQPAADRARWPALPPAA